MDEALIAGGYTFTETGQRPVKLFRYSLPVHFLPSTQQRTHYADFTSLPPGAASSHPTPVGIWQSLLSHLLQQHYGLTLNDTPFANDGVIEQHIDAGISCAMR